MKIVADDKIPFLKGVLDSVAEVCYMPGASIKKEDVKNADALVVRTRTHCNVSLLENTQVKMVATATAGIDHLDISWLNKAGIEWTNAAGCNAGSVQQYMASVLALLIKEGMNPEKAVIGIVGVGMVGSKVEALARLLGMRTLCCDPPRQRRERGNDFCSLETVLCQSDIITFHTPLIATGSDATFHLFNDHSLSKLKSGAIIINSSRGEVTSTQALLKGVETGRISRIVIDVWENEPHISPQLLNKAWIATPHIAGYSADGKANGTAMAVQAISRRFNLNLNNWKPSIYPALANTCIEIGFSDKNSNETVAETILHTYNVMDDDTRLRSNPDQFEKQRENYPLRREFEAWKILLDAKTVHSNALQTTKMVQTQLKSLGFTFQEQ